MTNDRPPTSFLIGAQTRMASKEGVSMVVRRRGDETQGAIILKIDRLDGTAHVLMQARLDEEMVWNPDSKVDPLPAADAERYLERQATIDPDIWIVEIEDRQGRHWFPGRVVKL